MRCRCASGEPVPFGSLFALVGYRLLRLTALPYTEPGTPPKTGCERRSKKATSIRLDGGEETLILQAFLVELGELFVALGDDGLALGVGF